MLVWRALALVCGWRAPHVSEWMQRRLWSVRTAIVVQRAVILAAALQRELVAEASLVLDAIDGESPGGMAWRPISKPRAKFETSP